MKVEFDTRALKIDPCAFYNGATLALSILALAAWALKDWGTLALAIVASGCAYGRMVFSFHEAADRLDDGIAALEGGLRNVEDQLSALERDLPPPEPRRVHGLCMFCQKDVFFDPMALNAGICEACAGGGA